MGWLLAGSVLSRCGNGGSRGGTAIANLGPLREPDENGLRLPAGFRSRIVARSGEVLGRRGYEWHRAPDGGAVFDTPDGGWIYVSNSEYAPGGVGALRFASNGDVVDAYPILARTLRNCAGGPTPWGTWLSCEEFDVGRVWECDPMGGEQGAVRPALGVFRHEAVAIDPVHQHAYLTEDVRDGRFYRFVPDSLIDGRANLSAGELQAAEVIGGSEGRVEWRTVPDPGFTGETPTRMQVPTSTAFDGGEGIWYHRGVVYFSTKGDNRIWAYDIDDANLTILYDAATSSTPILTGVDNVTVSAAGDVLVAEDGGDMQIVAITPKGSVLPIVQIVGQDRSEITGPAFGPGGNRLYFSSQRGFDGTLRESLGITYEVTGPFFA